MIKINKKIFIMLILPMYLQSTPNPGERLWDIAASNEIDFNLIQSKVCAITLNFNGTYTAINALNDTTQHNDSTIDVITSIVDLIDKDFVGTQTALAAALTKTTIIEQHTQSAHDNIIDAKDAIGTFITDADVGTTGFTISSPGKYLLCEDVTFSPGVANDAITIAADNVELNLNGFTIRQGNGTGSVQGIVINTGLSNVTIKNGLVKDTSSNGIDVGISSYIYIENVWIENVENDGINISSGGSNIIIQDTQVTNATDDGIFISASNNVTITGCLITGNGSSGMDIRDSSSRVTIKDCLVANNGATGAGVDGGIEIRGSTNIEVQNCFCVNNTNVSGIFLTNVDNALIKDNVCNSNEEEGIRVVSGSTQVKLIGNICIANDNQGIELNNATNCLVFENIALINGSANIDEQSGGPNSFLSNWALASTDGANYDATSSTINQVTINQSGTFPSEPTKWQNISMTT